MTAEAAHTRALAPVVRLTPTAGSRGPVRLVGTDEHAITDAVLTLLHDEAAYQAMAKALNPYGDGRAAQRMIDSLRHFCGVGPCPMEFGTGLLAHNGHLVGPSGSVDLARPRENRTCSVKVWRVTRGDDRHVGSRGGGSRLSSGRP